MSGVRSVLATLVGATIGHKTAHDLAPHLVTELIDTRHRILGGETPVEIVGIGVGNRICG